MLSANAGSSLVRWRNDFRPGAHRVFVHARRLVRTGEAFKGLLLRLDPSG